VERIKDLSMKPVVELVRQRADRATRFHRIDWKDDWVSECGFGINGMPTLDDEAWQFAVSANQHGRVHGFLIYNLFYVVWLDPDHKLYPGKG